MELTTEETLKLEALAHDHVLIDALRKVFIDARLEATTWNLTMSNEQIGAKFRAREEAKRLVDMALSKLAQFTPKEITNKANPAR